MRQSISQAIPSKPQEIFKQFNSRMELVNELLKCQAISNPSTRRSVVANLPDEISNSITRSEKNTEDVLNIVNGTLEYEDGLKKFLSIVEAFEGNSISMTNVVKLLKSFSTPQTILDAKINSLCGASYAVGVHYI